MDGSDELFEVIRASSFLPPPGHTLEDRRQTTRRAVPFDHLYHRSKDNAIRSERQVGVNAMLRGMGRQNWK
jgi:hypothetical protein